MRMSLTAFLIALIFVVAPVFAGQYNEVLSIGDPAPVWNELPGTDGKAHSFGEFKDDEALVIAFTCLSCPTAVDYEKRFDTLAKKYGAADGTAGRKAGFIAVCVNRVPEDRLDKLTERAKRQQLAFPIIYDESQKIARDYGAIFTPEYYVLNKERKVTYMGAFDDATDSTKVSKHFVENALISTLANESVAMKETLARGCRVRYLPLRN